MNRLNDFYSGRKVFITGSTGFKGSWLAMWLLDLGAKVYGYSLPALRTEDNFTLCNLGSHISQCDGDIRDAGALKTVIENSSADIVFHLAAQPLVLPSYHDPLTTFSTNMMGTINVLEACRACRNVRAAVIITTDKVYENREWLYGYRECDRLGGTDPYSASKACAELAVQSYIHSFFSGKAATAVATARAGNVIGGADWSEFRIVPDCIRALRKGIPIIVRNPDAVRPWQHVLDPLYGYLLLAKNLISDRHKEIVGSWNFGPRHDSMISVKDLVQRIIRHAGRGAYETAIDPQAPHEAAFLHLDISKATSLLGWSPLLKIDQAIEWTVREYEEKNVSSTEWFEGRIGHIRRYMSMLDDKNKSP
jgi:CDP-glucose 4,6-dehydratase